MNGRQYCGDHRFLTHVSMMLFRDNLDMLWENICFVESLGVNSLKVNIVENLGEWKAYQDTHGIQREEAWEAYLNLIPKLLEKQPKLSIELGGFLRYDPVKGVLPGTYEKPCRSNQASHFLLCGSLNTALYINSDGRVSPCVTMLDSSGDFNRFNILKTPLQEILEEPDFTGVGRLTAEEYLQANETCRNCEYRYACLGGCRAKAALSGNGILGIDEEVCAFFKEGWKDRRDKRIASCKE